MTFFVKEDFLCRKNNEKEQIYILNFFKEFITIKKKLFKSVAFLYRCVLQTIKSQKYRSVK